MKKLLVLLLGLTAILIYQDVSPKSDDGRRADPTSLAPAPTPPLEPQKVLMVASWYGEPFHGRITASGERFDMYNSFSVAHRFLPFGTKLRLTNPRNGNTVEAVVNDRGPYILGRDIDLSFRVAFELGCEFEGVVCLWCQILPPNQKPTA